MSWGVGDSCGFKRSISRAGNAVQYVVGCQSGSTALILEGHWEGAVPCWWEMYWLLSRKPKEFLLVGRCSLLVLLLPSKKFSAAQGGMPSVGPWSSVFPAEPLRCVFQHSDSCLLHGFCAMESYSHFLYRARSASCVGQRLWFGIDFTLHVRLEKNPVLSKNIACKSVLPLMPHSEFAWILELTTHSWCSVKHRSLSLLNHTA